MSQRLKKMKKHQEEEEDVGGDVEIAMIHQKKQLHNSEIQYLVQYVGGEGKEWRDEKDIQNLPSFKRQHHNFVIAEVKKNVKQSIKIKTLPHDQSKQIIQEEKRQQSTSETKKTSVVANEAWIQKLKSQLGGMQQQLSLDKFVGKTQSKEVVKPETIKRDVKDSSPGKIVIKQSLQQENKMEIERQSVPQLSQTPKFNPMWLQKIKMVSRIKGYQLKNDDIFYEVDVIDKNGQNLFVPPMPSQIVKKYDMTKLAVFLQDSLFRGAAEAKTGVK